MTVNSPFGLDQLEVEQKEQQETTQRQQDEINNLYAKCFNTEAGQKVLKHLSNCTTEQPTWVPSGGDGRTAIQHAFLREGQNSIVRNIIDRINSTKEPK